MKHILAVEVLSLWLVACGMSNAGIESFANPCVGSECPKQVAPPQPMPSEDASKFDPADQQEADAEADSKLERLDPHRAPIMRSARPSEELEAVRVEGYREREYVYGELLRTPHAVLEGYVYRKDGTRVYVYGEQSETGRIEAYDRQGQLFLLTVSDW